MRVIGFESTPNPNALKCLMAMASGSSPARATGHGLAEALFALDGVTNVLVMSGWVTVCKRADAAWKTLKPKLKRVIEAHAAGSEAGAEARRAE